jgi:hypothetical protein
MKLKKRGTTKILAAPLIRVVEGPSLVLAMSLVLPFFLALGPALALILLGILLAFVVVLVATHLAVWLAKATVVVTHRALLRHSRDNQQGSDEECRAQVFQFFHRASQKLVFLKFLWGTLILPGASQIPEGNSMLWSHLCS